MLKKLFPILEWLPNYKREWLRGDVIAGITVGIIIIPQGIAYAMIVGIPPIYGLYTAMIPQLIYAIFGTSRSLSVGPVAMDSLIVGAGIATLAEVGTNNFLEFAILLASIIGVLQILFGVLKMGFIVNFLSKPVISGFTSAAALIIGLSQLNHLFGITLERNSQLQNILYEVSQHIREIHFNTFLIGIIAIVIIFLLKKFANKLPAALIVVVIGIILSKLFHFENYGVQVVGKIPNELPFFKVPNFNFELIKKLFPIAFTLAFIGFLEAISIAKASEARHPECKINANKELIALGLGNMIGSFFQCYPSTGSFSRTAVAEQNLVKSPFYAIISAFIVGLTLMFLTPVFYFLPKAILAAIIIVSVIGLIDFKIPKDLWKYSKVDFAILNFTLLITAVIGIKEGILLGVFLSITKLVYKSAKPHVAVLGRIPGTHFYRHIHRFEEVEIDDRILIVRFDAQIHFANVNYFKDKLEEFAKAKGDQLALIIIDGESMNKIDSDAIFTIYEVIEYFHSRNIELYFTGLKGPVRDSFKQAGITEKLGIDAFFMNNQNGVDAFNKISETKNSTRKHLKFVSQTNK